MAEAKEMTILAVETSCDDTAISVIRADGEKIRVLSNIAISQINVHREYGGVFPAMAKREHAKNLVPMLEEALENSKIKIQKSKLQLKNQNELTKLLEREPELLNDFLNYIPTIGLPEIDAIAVTQGPGLPPALWVGVNFARALSLAWGKPLIPVNHMEGHYFSALIRGTEFPISDFSSLKTPALALLISGGHTQIVLSEKFLKYKIVGETRDDAVGEAFDKAARVLSLPYPGGPEISRRAARFRESKEYPSGKYTLPRPMIHSGDFDFSFSGIKTAVLYMVQKIPEMTEEIREEICYEFEEAVTETLMSKMRDAAGMYAPETVILGGGVSANAHIQDAFKKTFKTHFPLTEALIPARELSGDNALMIAVVGYLRAIYDPKRTIPHTSEKLLSLSADGNLKL